MRTGDEGLARGGAGDDQADWVPPFAPEEGGGGGRDHRYEAPRAGSGAGLRPAIAWYVPFAGRLLTLMALGMICAALVFGFLGVTTTRSISSTNAVALPAANPVVHITSAVGSVRVVPIPLADPGKAGKITVDATTEVRHLSPFLAESALRGGEIAPVVRDGEVYIDTQPDGDGEIFSERSTRVTVYVPQGTTLDLRVQLGGASVTGITGPMTIEVSGGLLNVIDSTIGDGSRLEVNGGSAHFDDVILDGRSTLAVNGGHIDLRGKLGATAQLSVAVNGGNASLRLPLNTNARLDGAADGGSLNITGWLGTITRSDPLNGNQRWDGFLSADTTTTNRITLRVSGGGISLRPQQPSERPELPATPPAVPLRP